MSYFKGILLALSQNSRLEEEAIQTLSNRLQHATLVADRKSAVLGLKSFSRQFRESVVQYGLRALLSTLEKDADNASLVKAVLETLLNLFLRTSEALEAETETLGWISNQSRAQNGKYPSPLLVEQVEIDEFSNWIADEMILADSHVQSLMQILQQHSGFQIRLYALQLLEAVVATRPMRAKECILNIPLAISTVVGLLDDANDPIRNETILLLMALVNHNFNIQKLVAFENTFERIFQIIDEEGGIRGSILVQDCMTLLTNLLMYNASNQTFFLETDCVPKLASLIAEPLENSAASGRHDDSGNAIPAPPIVWTDQRLQNMTVLLEICRSFVDPENQHLVQNQHKLFLSGIFFSILRLVFSPVMENPIRRTALQVTGDILSNNAELQLQFALIDVPYIDPSMPLQVQKYTEAIPAPVALLNWALWTNSVHIFEVRLAAMYCLARFFLGNADAKMAFLTDQIKASKNLWYYSELKQAQAAENAAENGNENGHETETLTHSDDSHNTPYANIFTLLTTFKPGVKLNPYSVWFSAITLVYLIGDCPEARKEARNIKVGNADQGEEEMTAIQAVSGMLLANLENSDPRIAVGYLILLTLWLYEDFDAVDDFLSDASVVKTVVAFLSKNSTELSEIVQGMASVLVGVCYDFSTKSLPLPRANVYELITKGLGADSYALKVKQLKNSVLFKQFHGDLESDFEKDSLGLPNLFFIPEYAELVKDNYYRIRKSLTRGPEFEPRSRISFEIYEELENKNVELKIAVKELSLRAEENAQSFKAQVEAKETKLRETSDTLDICMLELNKARSTEWELAARIETLAANIKVLEADKEKFESSSAHYTSEYHKLSKKTASDEESMNQLKQKLSDTEAAKQKAEDGINKMSRELFQLTKQKMDGDSTIGSLERKISKLETQHEHAIKEYQATIDASKETNEALRVKLALLEQRELKTASSNDEQALAQMRDLQGKVREMEETNDGLMEKLRSAAAVVLDLRAHKSALEKEKESLESALAKTYEDLEAFTHLLKEVEDLRAKNQQYATEVASRDVQTPLNDVLTSISEEKTKLEDNLLQSETTETLQVTLAELQERGTVSQEQQQNLDDTKPYGKKGAVPQSQDTEISGTVPPAKKAASESQTLISETEAELAALRSDLQQSKTTLELETARYNEDMARLTQEHLELLTRHEKLVEEYERLKSSAEKADDTTSNKDEGQVADEIKKRDKDLEISLKRIKDLEKNIDVLSESASASLASFKNSQNSMKTRIEGLEDVKQSLLSEVEELKSERIRMVAEFQEAYDELESSYVDLELLLANLEKHKDEVEKQLKKNQQDSSARIAKLTTETEELKKTLAETQSERDELRAEYYELEKLTNIIGSELQAKEALLQAITNKGADLAAKDKIVIEIKEKLASTIAELGDSAQQVRVLNKENLDLRRSHEGSLASVDAFKQSLRDLGNQLVLKSEELEISLSENRKLASIQKNFYEASKANEESSAKVEALEKEISGLMKTLSEVKLELDEQRKLNRENSLAAVLEFTEKSIFKSQQLHDSELVTLREATAKEIQKLTDELATLKDENQALLAQWGANKKLFSESEGKAEDFNVLKQRAEAIQKELEQLKAALVQCQDRISENDLEVEAKAQEMVRMAGNHRDITGKIESEVSELKAELDKLKLSAAYKDELIGSLTEEKENFLTDLQNMQSKTSSDLEAAISSGVAELEKTQALYRETKDELSRKTEELESQSELLIHAQESIKQLDYRIRNLEETEGQLIIGDLKDQIKYLENEVQVSREEKNDLSKVSSKNGEHLDPAENDAEGSKTNESVSNNVESHRLHDEITGLKRDAQREQERFTARISELKESLEEKSEELRKAQTELEDQRLELTASIDELKQGQEAWERRFTEQEIGWKTKLQHGEEEISAKKEVISNLNIDIRQLEEKLDSLSSTGLHNGPSKEAGEDIEIEKVLEDFDDLMLICESQEQKLRKYKRKLRALDISVSSNESEPDQEA